MYCKWSSIPKIKPTGDLSPQLTVDIVDFVGFSESSLENRSIYSLQLASDLVVFNDDWNWDCDLAQQHWLVRNLEIVLEAGRS